MKYNLYSTVPVHPNYTFPNEFEISNTLEVLGYDYFLPKNIFADLIALYSQHMMDVNIKYLLKFIDLPSDLRQFYVTLPYDFLGGSASSPLSKAIITLKELSKSLDLRSLDNGIVSEVNSHNFIVDPDKTTQLLVKQSETKLDPSEQAKLVKLLELFKTVLPVAQNNYVSRALTRKMKNFSEVFQTRKSALVRPDFDYKFVNKRLNVGSKEQQPEEEKVIIYLEDASSSMDKGTNFVASKAIQKLLCDETTTVYYYRFANKIEVYKLTSFEEKITIFSQEKTYYKSKCDYMKLFNLINAEHHAGNIIISTDGEDVFDSQIRTHLKVFTISHLANTELSNLCKQTGGQFLIL